MATLYDIRLEFGYDYERPATMGRHVLRLLPANTPEQQLISGLVTLDPLPDDRRDSHDFFGNSRSEIAYDRPINEVSFRMNARVRRSGVAPTLDLSPSLSALGGEIASVASLGREAPHHYIGVSERVRPHPEMTAFARAALEQAAPGAEVSVFEALKLIGRALYLAMTFDPEATEVDTDAEEAFRIRRGVCQDFTHILIACLRGLGVPAGYVSGFLRTIPPPGKERLEGADAMHAWVQAWCGRQMGWVEYDPTNDLMVASDHIVVARGRDYSDVAPIRGQLRAAGKQKASQKVDVIPL